MMTLHPLNRRRKTGLFLVLVDTGLSLCLEARAKQTAGIVLLGLAATWFFGSVRLRTLGLMLTSAACCAGLYLTIAPVREERESYSAQAAEYDQALLDIREAVGKAIVWDNEPPEKTRMRGQKAQKPWERYGTTRLDTVQHPTLGTLKFPHDMPFEERNQHIDRMLAERAESLPKLVQRQRTVQIPEIAQKWERLTPEERDGEWVTVQRAFPADMSEQDIIREFQTKILLPRPTFSFRAAFRSHLLSSVAGSLLFLFWLLGWTLLVWPARRKRPENATQTA